MKQKDSKHLLLGFLSISLILALVGCNQNKEQSSVLVSSSELPSQSTVISTDTGTSILPSSSSSEVPTTSSSIDYGTVTIRDMEIAFQGEMFITPAFEHEEYEEDLTYTFEGNNISIVDNKIKGLIPGTVTIVTAKSEHFETTFNVTVTYIQGVLTNDTGAESKFQVPLPDVSVKNYVLHLTVKANTYIAAYTRISSFAFNGSDNSWYNMELSGGRIYLFAHFNGIEKYYIYVGDVDEFVVNDVLTYQVEIAKKGQKTLFYINDKLLCGFNETEMAGYPELSEFEVTAAADREGAGKYEIELNNVFWELENTDAYAKYSDPTKLSLPNKTLANVDGDERKLTFGNLVGQFPNVLYSTTIDVEKWDDRNFRPCAFAFNGSDNSWYNIEMNAEGNLNLFGRFNGVEKYWIFLGNRVDLMKDNMIHFTVDILKQGQATAFYFNGKLVCNFLEHEMNGYAQLGYLEVTSTSDVWQEGKEYIVHYSNINVYGENSDEYNNFVYGNYADVELVSNDAGHECKQLYGLMPTNCLFGIDVEIKQKPNDWFRPVALAFNDSDNSWYNIETGTDGTLTLFARFNGVEKYFIALGNQSDYTEGGKTVLPIKILKQGQATYFFLGETLKCSFSEQELNGNPKLGGMFATACADRTGGQFKVGFKATLEKEGSETYNKFAGLIAQ